MPGWHKTIQKWVAQNKENKNKIQILGITQEQHAQRCELFAQWKKFDWPILHDPINLMGSKVVPIVIAIDEHGIVRSTRPNMKTIESSFLNKQFEKPKNLKLAKKIAAKVPDLKSLLKKATQENTAPDNTAEAWRTFADAQVLWGKPAQIDVAVNAYIKSLAKNPKNAKTLFRLGVCYRMRYESQAVQSGDFQLAVDHWNKALALNPNQYIWRRRIQQYGPRLTKPYSFYDWVHQANKEITARGEKPIKLAVSPSGAEFAYPSRSFKTDDKIKKSPDAGGKINRDTNRLINIQATRVQGKSRKMKTARVHLTFRCNAKLKAHWNNEAEPLTVWVENSDGIRVQKNLFTAKGSKAAQSDEVRRIDFEIDYSKIKDDQKLKLYALYYVCEGKDGTCLYLRQDVKIPLK